MFDKTQDLDLLHSLMDKLFSEINIHRSECDEKHRKEDIVMAKVQQILSAKYGFDLNQMHNWGTDYEVDPENYGKNFNYN